MKKNKDIFTLRAAIAEYGDYNGFVFIHKYNVHGTFKYMVSEISEKMLDSEIMLVQKHAGGRECEYNAVMYIVK